MKLRTLSVLTLFLLSAMTPMLGSANAQNSTGMEILDTAVNPLNNHTYHLLSASSWEDAAEAARGLDGFLTTIDSAEENQWVFDTFASFDNQSRHLWTGLSDADNDGVYKWHDGSPFYYNNWGESQPSEGGDEDYVHIASTNMGNIMPASWNDLENDPQYFPVYGVVEVGEGADFSLRFNGDGDRIEVPHEDSLNITGSIHLSAMVYPYTLEGIQFITMKGDYGWGMYLNGGRLAYASEYSLSKHPLSNLTVQENAWTHVEVELTESVGGEFRINGQSAGLISAEASLIPLGDFGSNDCFTSGDDCDELYIGSMGAGCECNYFEGMLDNISIGSNSETADTTAWVSNWSFGEGEGSFTADLNQRNGTIYGADWVMPDGTIVAQAVELQSGIDYYVESAQAGDQLLFYGDVDEMSKEMYFNMISMGEFGKEPITIDVYVGHDYVPSSWEHDYQQAAEYGYMWEQWTWPEEGNWWFVLVPQEDISDLTVTLTWVIADPPPALDDMTELLNGIPVTGQSIDSNRQTPFEERTLYYYVNVTEPLSSLSVQTYDGEGNINLGLSWGTVPDPFDQWLDFFDGSGFINEESNGVGSKIAWSNNPGSEETATLYDIEPGLYYVTAYTYQRANDFTIRADMTYAPENIEPEVAIELTPGVAYGPLSGYDGLLQYFKIDVPTGTERLEVDLSEGYGEATLFMQYLEAPDAANYDHRSGTPGAGDKIGFNDPTPGMWFILVYTDEIFANTMITASFEDRYVWSYDGTPIQLYNNEEITGIEAPAGEELYFFVELENPAEYLEVSTYGGDGALSIEGQGDQLFFDWNGGFDGDGDDGRPTGGRQGGMAGMEYSTQPVSVVSFGEGTSQSIFIDMAANGRFDFTLIATEDVVDVSIIASWFELDIPIDPTDPINPGEPGKATACDVGAKAEFAEADADGSGVLDMNDFSSGADGELSAGSYIIIIFDADGDGEVEYREFLQVTCSCENELQIFFDDVSRDGLQVSLEELELHTWLNTYDFESVNTNDDAFLDMGEMEMLMLVCETTFDAFDGDGDGVPDKDDAFPKDPDESVDTDGDGVGDNADIAPSVANDVIYSAGAMVFILLVGILVFFLRSGNAKNEATEWTMPQETSGFDERMMAMDDKLLPAIEMESNKENTDVESNIFETYASQPDTANVAFSEVSDLFTQREYQSPPSELMGMLNEHGIEVIEFPAGSGVGWKRTDATQQWTRK